MKTFVLLAWPLVLVSCQALDTMQWGIYTGTGANSLFDQQVPACRWTNVPAAIPTQVPRHCQAGLVPGRPALEPDHDAHDFGSLSAR